MEKNRFRNHWSFAIERIGAFFIMIVALAFFNLDDILSDIIKGNYINTKNIIPILLGIAGFIVLVVVVVWWNVRIWLKTWITIDDDTITIDRNTINSKKNTMGIKNISNVNLEQNILEMVLGTNKVKIDTNSLSTANATDVMIILKKEEAIQFKEFLETRIAQTKGNDNSSDNVKDGLEAEDNSQGENKAEGEGKALISTPKQIVWHSVYNINIASAITIAGIIIGFVGKIFGDIFEKDLSSAIVFLIAMLLVVGSIVVAIAWNMISQILKMYGFTAKRVGDKLLLKYGLIKNVDFSIPVDKINAIKIKQTFIARIFNKYSVEMINVGMGDEKDQSADFVFYCSKEEMKRNIEILLPEFKDSLDGITKKQPKNSIIISAIYSMLFVGVVTTGIICVWIGLEKQTILPFIAIMLTVIAFCIIFVFMGYNTKGYSSTAKYFKLVNGHFSKKCVIIKYDKIQFIKTQQNILTKKLGITKGNAFILAKLTDAVQSFPYIDDGEIDNIKRWMIEE